MVLKTGLLLTLIMSFIGCATGGKVQPALIAGDKQISADEYKYSNDCKSWLDQESYEKAVVSPAPRYSYMELLTSDPSQNESPRLIQYDSKDRVYIGDNMTFVSKLSEVAKEKELRVATFSHHFKRFALSVSNVKLPPGQTREDINLMRGVDHGSWSLNLHNDSGEGTVFIYTFSKNLPSKYALVKCSKKECLLVKLPKLETINLEKNSPELKDVSEMSGFNKNLLADIDQMCAPSTRAQFVKTLQTQREEYMKNCKIILSDDAVVRKWTALCHAYRNQIKPALRTIL